MTKELEQKIYRMLKSTDKEMVFLGIHLLLNNATQHECMKMIPWNYVNHGRRVIYEYINNIPSKSINVNRGWTRDPFELHLKGDTTTEEYHTIWIKGNIAIAFMGGSLICRRLGLMKCLHDFEQRPKVIYDAR